MDSTETRRVEISSIRNVLNGLLVEITNKHLKKKPQTVKRAKSLRFHLQHTTHLDWRASLTHIIVEAMPWERMQTRTPQLRCSHTLRSLHLVCHLDL